MEKESSKLYLYIVLLGCRPHGRQLEQHDIFFGVAPNLFGLRDSMKTYWVGASGLHIDGFIKAEYVEGYHIEISSDLDEKSAKNLYFINLGGYEHGVLDEKHQRILLVANEMSGAIKKAKQHPFYSQGADVGHGGKPHVDDRYELNMDIDDVIDISDILKSQGYQIKLTLITGSTNSPAIPGYIKLENLEKSGY